MRVAEDWIWACTKDFWWGRVWKGTV